LTIFKKCCATFFKIPCRGGMGMIHKPSIERRIKCKIADKW
jgi:hypothetical protein